MLFSLNTTTMKLKTTLVEALISKIAVAREDDSFTDLTLTHADIEFNVHKIVVCSQSKVIYKACTSGFKESFGNVFPMTDISLQEFRRLIQFMYSLDYSEDPLENESPEDFVSALQLHALMFKNGDKYDIPALRKAAVDKYQTRCSKSWNAEEFINSISEVYESTADSVRELRDVVINVSRSHLPKSLNFEENIEELHADAVQNVPEYAQDLLFAFLKTPLHIHCSTCHVYQPMDPLQAKCRVCNKGNSCARIF